MQHGMRSLTNTSAQHYITGSRIEPQTFRSAPYHPIQRGIWLLLPSAYQTDQTQIPNAYIIN